MEHVIHWLLTNVQRVMALVDPGDECSLVHGKPEQFPGRSTYIDGYGAQSIEVEAVSLPLEIGQLPVRVYIVYVSPILEYILGQALIQSAEESGFEICLLNSETSCRLESRPNHEVAGGSLFHLHSQPRNITVRCLCLVFPSTLPTL